MKLLSRASSSPASARPGSVVAQARDLLHTAQESFDKNSFEEAFQLAVESESYSRRALSGSNNEEMSDASFIFIEGDVALQTAGRSTFERAKQREALYDGDFIKTGRTGSAEIMFSDGTLYTIRPGSLFEVRRPPSPEVSGSQVKMVSGAVNVYTAASNSTVQPMRRPRRSAASPASALDVEAGEKTQVTTFAGGPPSRPRKTRSF